MTSGRGSKQRREEADRCIIYLNNEPTPFLSLSIYEGAGGTLSPSLIDMIIRDRDVMALDDHPLVKVINHGIIVVE